VQGSEDKIINTDVKYVQLSIIEIYKTRVTVLSVGHKMSNK